MGSGTSAPKKAPLTKEEELAAKAKADQKLKDDQAAKAQEAIVLSIGEILHDAEEAFRKGKQAEAFAMVQDAHKVLFKVEEAQYDNYATMIYAREGKLYFMAEDYDRAQHAYDIAIQRAEVRIAQRCRGLYLLLQRYTDCMTDRCRIWEIAAEKADATAEAKAALYAKCELGLLRCIEMIEEGHNRRSDMLILPMTRLSALYERLGLYKKAELLLRRCQGIIIVQFGYDHADLQRIDAKLALLETLNDGRVAAAAIKIQSVVRMFIHKRRVAAVHGKTFKRHELAPPAIRNERDKGEYLTKLSNLLEPGTAMGHQVVGEGGGV